MMHWKSDTDALPLVGIAGQSATTARELQLWLCSNRHDVQQLLHLHGAILFRGFQVACPELFQSIAGVFCPQFGEYIGGNSPRTRVSGNVFSSTEYSREARISMHNEASYLRQMPRHILFCCVRPAVCGGQTPIADCRRVLNHIDPEVRRRFDRFGLRYVNNMHSGIGLGNSWMDVYCTKSPSEVEARLKEDGNTWQWHANGSLRVFMNAPATSRHPTTQDEVWINQAEQWHPSSLDPEFAADLMMVLEDDELPHNAFLGDGSPLAPLDLVNIREAMAIEERTFEWQVGDVLLCDNILVMHGRQPFVGDRKILAAMD